MFTLAVLVSCGKEALPADRPKGEAVALTIAPETKVGIEGNEYVFEAGDKIIAVAENGSIAELSNSESTVDKFNGTFSEPLGSSKFIDLYYNCCDAEGKVNYAQNGKPWLEAVKSGYDRNDDGSIRISAALTAPEGVRAIGVISTCGATAVDFHANSVSVSTFDGTSFAGEKSITGISLQNGPVFVNVPAGMNDGFWLKFTDAEGRAMYKKYASATAIDQNYKVNVSEFVPVNVDFNVSVSGFATSYSYYAANEGIEGIDSKDVNAANAVANDWMGAGKATFSVSKEGIPSSLLKFDSFTLVVDGEAFTYSGDESGEINVEATTGHNTWGQKDITATVKYKTEDGQEFSASKTITRQITGLPYVAAPPKNSGDNPWKVERGNDIRWNDEYVTLSTIALHPQIGSPLFNIPKTADSSDGSIDVAASTKVTRNNAILAPGKLQISLDTDVVYKETLHRNATYEGTLNQTMTSSQNNWHISYSYAAVGMETYVYYFNINYR